MGAGLATPGGLVYVDPCASVQSFVFLGGQIRIRACMVPGRVYVCDIFFEFPSFQSGMSARLADGMSTNSPSGSPAGGLGWVYFIGQGTLDTLTGHSHVGGSLHPVLDIFSIYLQVGILASRIRHFRNTPHKGILQKGSFAMSILRQQHGASKWHKGGAHQHLNVQTFFFPLPMQ